MGMEEGRDCGDDDGEIVGMEEGRDGGLMMGMEEGRDCGDEGR